jgi:hypothetical protein
MQLFSKSAVSVGIAPGIRPRNLLPVLQDTRFRAGVGAPYWFQLLIKLSNSDFNQLYVFHKYLR